MNTATRKIWTYMIGISLALIIFLPNNAHAQLCCKCADTIENYIDDLFVDGLSAFPSLLGNSPSSAIETTTAKTIRHIEGEFTTHKQWIAGVVWEDNILPALMMMTDELSNIGFKQTEVIGALFDAKIQMETQQVIQIEEAKIHKNYAPSMGLCTIGTGTKSLAATDMRSEVNRLFIAQRVQDRHLGKAFTSAYKGSNTDTKSRLTQFKENYCNALDNTNAMGSLCGNSKNKKDKNRRNKDIDYTRTLEAPWTLNIDLTDSLKTNDEENIFALSSNIYGNKVPKRIAATSLGDEIETGAMEDRKLERGKATDLHKSYMDLRSFIAKRSVAENSFNAIAAMKSSGTGGSREYMVNILQGLGYTKSESSTLTNMDNDAGIRLGDEDIMEYEQISTEDPSQALFRRPKPSYYAQMEILTNKMFQNPNFYKDLYDKPINVDRKHVALQAIGIMQKFDTFKSYLRQESAVSLLLEEELIKMQSIIENKL